MDQGTLTARIERSALSMIAQLDSISTFVELTRGRPELRGKNEWLSDGQSSLPMYKWNPGL